MRVVSMVPSWTETLIEAGVEVVGRTRFCVHPTEKVKSIPVVGGTKDINWEKLKTLDFDLLLLDKEENPKEMADDARCEVVATHVKSCDDVVSELRSLSKKLENETLAGYANRWEIAIGKQREKPSARLIQLHELQSDRLKNFGIQRWIAIPQQKYESIVYVIWQNPTMAITKETFIGSMLDLVGLSTSLSFANYQKPYPEIDLSQFDREKTLFLFSSEPFPFHKKISELEKLGFAAAAIVDGEAYSWFGLRALYFLENQFK